MLPHSVLLELSARADVAIALAILAAVALALGGLWLTRIERSTPATSAPAASEPSDGGASAPEPALPAVPWWRAAGSDVPGDVTARTALVEELGMRGDRDAALVLVRAWREERDPGVRDAVLAALRACDGEPPLEIFHEALADGSEAQRILAIEGFEGRGHHEPIVQALSDPSDVVALAAAIALYHSGKREPIEDARERRGASFAAMLDLLEF